MTAGLIDGPLYGGYDDSEMVPAPEIPVTTKMGRPSVVTSALWSRLCDMVRRGSFKHVAAKACGISRTTVHRYSRDNEEARLELESAEAEARVDAETRVHQADPKAWLNRGPGRDRGDPDEPGWTSAPKEVKGSVVHSHTHEVKRPDLSGLSDAELAQLEVVTAKLLPDKTEDR